MNIRFFREIGGIDIAGAEARVDLIGFSGTTEEAAEKLETWGEVRKIEIAGAEARVDSIGFSGSTEVVPCYTACSEGVFRQL